MEGSLVAMAAQPQTIPFGERLAGPQHPLAVELGRNFFQFGPPFHPLRSYLLPMWNISIISFGISTAVVVWPTMRGLQELECPALLYQLRSDQTGTRGAFDGPREDA
jgi:hypothetical protein